MIKTIQIESVSYSQFKTDLADMLGGNLIHVKNIPNVELNAKQAATFLGIAHNTLIKLMEQNEIHNVSTSSRIMFALPELFTVLPRIEALKYNRK